MVNSKSHMTIQLSVLGWPNRSETTLERRNDFLGETLPPNERHTAQWSILGVYSRGAIQQFATARDLVTASFSRAGNNATRNRLANQDFRPARSE